MSELVHPKIISGNSNITLSKGIASWASSLSRSQIDLVEGRVEQFNDQEIFVEVFENVRNEDMFKFFMKFFKNYISELSN